MNNINITGRAIKDVSIKFLDDGKAVATLSIADSRKDGGEEITIFYDVSIWGSRAEVAAQYIKKSSLVSIVGRLDPPRVHDGKAYLKVMAYDFTLPPRTSSEVHSPPSFPAVARPSQAPSRHLAPTVVSGEGIPF
jgi:single-stranded DNA-binding protein